MTLRFIAFARPLAKSQSELGNKSQKRSPSRVNKEGRHLSADITDLQRTLLRRAAAAGQVDASNNKEKVALGGLTAAGFIQEGALSE